MLAIMKELVRVKYRYMIFPEHARGLDVDRDPGNEATAAALGLSRPLMCAGDAAGGVDGTVMGQKPVP